MIKRSFILKKAYTALNRTTHFNTPAPSHPSLFFNLIYILCVVSISASWTAQFKYQPAPSFPKGCRSLLRGTAYLHEVIASQKARRQTSILPANDMTDLRDHERLSSKWNKPPSDVPSLVQLMLPPGATPINHQLEFHQSFSAVKLSGGDPFVPVRVQYTHSKDGEDIVLGTNAYATSTFLHSNIVNVLEGNAHKRSLSDFQAEYVAFLMSGGGTRSASGSIYGPAAATLSTYGISTLAIDTEMHSEGSRYIFENAEEHTRARMSFINQYVHPDQKIIIGGHSLGGIEAIRIWNMLNQDPSLLPNNEVLAVVALSPALDPAPGHSPAERIQAFKNAERLSRIKAQTEPPEHERNLWSTELVLNRKLSLLGEIYTLDNLTQASYDPHSKRNNPIPLYIVIGKWDPLFLGYEIEAQLEQLAQIHNVHVIPPLDERPLLKTQQMTRVGHALPDYQFSPENTTALHIQYILNFLSQETRVPLQDMKENNLKTFTNVKYSALYELGRLYLQSLGFRSWLSEFEIEVETPTQAIQIKNEARLIAQREARNILINNLPINLFAKEIQFLSKVQSEQDMQNSLNKLKNIIDKILEQNPNLESHLNNILSAESPESARRKARDIAQALFVNEDASFKVSSIEKKITSAEDQNALMKLLRSFPEDNTHWTTDISYGFISEKVQNKVVEIWNAFQSTTDRKQRQALLSQTNSLMRDHLPKNITYDILTALSDRPPLSLEEYQEELQKHHNHISIILQQYKDSSFLQSISKDLSSLSYQDVLYLLTNLELMIQAKSIEEMSEIAQQIFTQYTHIKPISKAFINKSGIINRQTTTEQLKESLQQLLLAPQDISRAINMFHSQQGRRPIYDFIREKALINQVHNLLDFLKTLAADSIIEQVKKYVFPPELRSIDINEVQRLKQTNINDPAINDIYNFIESIKDSIESGWAFNQIEQILKSKKQQKAQLAIDFINKLDNAHWLYSKLQEIQTANPQDKPALAYEALEQGKFFRHFIWTNKNHPDLQRVMQSLGGDLVDLETTLYADEIKSAIRKQHRTIKKINQITSTTHQPVLQDFYDHYENNQTPVSKSAKKDQQFLRNINRIQGIIKQISDLEKELNQLRAESKKLWSNDIHSLRHQVQQAIRIVSEAIQAAFRNPPASLQAQYQKLSAQLDELIPLYDTLEIDIIFDDIILPFLDGTKTRSNQAYISAVNSNKQMAQLLKRIKNIESRLFPGQADLEIQLIPALIRGELEDLVPGSQKAAIDLYGPDGQALYIYNETGNDSAGSPKENSEQTASSKYTEWQYKAFQLAQMEARILAISQKLAHLKQYYYRLYPDMPQYVSSLINGDLLNPVLAKREDQAQELRRYIDLNNEDINRLYATYVSMKGSIVPVPLPIPPQESATPSKHKKTK